MLDFEERECEEETKKCNIFQCIVMRNYLYMPACTTVHTTKWTTMTCLTGWVDTYTGVEGEVDVISEED